MTLECWDTELWLFPKWTTPQCDPARMKGYQTLARFWVHHNVSTMKGRTNKQTNKLAAAVQALSPLSQLVLLHLLEVLDCPRRSNCAGVHSARPCTPVRTHVVLARWTEHGCMWADVFYFTREEQNISMALQLLFLPPLLDYNVIR
jgi:hypothetical protein